MAFTLALVAAVMPATVLAPQRTIFRQTTAGIPMTTVVAAATPTTVLAHDAGSGSNDDRSDGGSGGGYSGDSGDGFDDGNTSRSTNGDDLGQ